MSNTIVNKRNPNIIKRHSRIREPLPEHEVSIKAPATAPQPPNKPNLLSFLPTVMMALVTGGVYYGINGSVSPLMIVPMMSMGLMTMGIQSWIHRRSVKEHNQQLEADRQNYRSYVEKMDDELADSARKQQMIRHSESPVFRDMVTRVAKRHRALWERQPNDNDFLDLRIGHGAQPFTVSVKLDDRAADDPRSLPAQKLVAKYEFIKDLPITANLNKMGSTVILGSRASESLYLAFNMIAGLAIHHSPDEVHLYIFSHRNDAPERWNWARWLPHTASLHMTEEQISRISFSRDTDEDLLADLRQRLDGYQQDKAQSFIAQPHIVVVFDQTPNLLGHPVMNKLLSYKPHDRESNSLHASVIFIDSPAPEQANLLINVQKDELEYREVWSSDANQVRLRGKAEYADLKAMEKMARDMAPLRTEIGQGASNSLPSSVRLVELLKATQPDEVDLVQFYRPSYDSRHVMRFPVGKNVDLKPQEIILRESGEGGYGAHAMLAGMTGQGKSVMLQAMVLSMAATNSPDHLNLVLADFKGGASELAKLKDLPHVVGFVTDLNPALVERFRIALESEVFRRKTMFDTAVDTLGTPVANIRSYNKAASKPLPHLVVVLDEFAHGLRINPNFRSAMDTIAAQGRALGIHLILSTQRALDFDNNIRPNIEIRLSLRVTSREDSRAMFNRDEAFSELKRPGQSYLQVGDNQIFEMFQAARADTPYRPDGTRNIELQDDFTIFQVEKDGRRQQLYRHKAGQKQVKSATTTISEAEVLVNHIRTYCQQHYDPARIICLPPLPAAENLPLFPLLNEQPAYQRWHSSEGWTDTRKIEHRLSIPMGLVDMPADQAQRPYTLDLNFRDGNFLVIGPAGSGKGLFLRSLVLGLAMTHSPGEVQFYMLRRGQVLSVFEDLPHCGALIQSYEQERISRLFSYLADELYERTGLMRQAKVDNMTNLRQVYPDKSLPAIIVIFDDFAGFKSDHEDKLEMVKRIAREGLGVDIHTIITSSALGDIHMRIQDNLANRLALGLKSSADYLDVLGKRAEILGVIPGRGYIRIDQEILECQIASPTRTKTDDIMPAQDVVKEIQHITERMKNSWRGELPREIIKLPKYLEIEALWNTYGYEVNPTEFSTAPIGLEFDDMRPINIDFGKLETCSLVIGPGESGKTEYLISLCLSAAKVMGPEQIKFYIISFNQKTLLRALRKLAHVEFAFTKHQAKQLLTELEQSLKLRQRERMERTFSNTETGFLSGPLPQRTVIIIDEIQSFVGSDELNNLVDQCAIQADDLGINIILADSGPNFTMAKNTYYNAKYLKAAFQYSAGTVFSTEDSHANLLKLSTRMNGQTIKMHSPQIGKGRGFLCYQNQANVVQFARLGNKNQAPQEHYDHLERLAEKIADQYKNLLTDAPAVVDNGYGDSVAEDTVVDTTD